MPRECILFVTGKLAETSLRRVVEQLAAERNFESRIEVLGISVAALMHAEWVERKLPELPGGVTRAILPGWCQGDLAVLRAKWNVPVELGPKDLFNLPEYLGGASGPPADLSQYDIEILAEINHAPRLSLDELLRRAEAFRRDGADVIDLGCIPGETWEAIGPSVKQLRAEGHRVSVDSFNRREVEAGVEAGAELVLSANSSNADWACDVPVEWVVIPDDPQDLASLEATAGRLESAKRKRRVDPILEPIGFGFATSLQRYYAMRARRPDRDMLMGIGNLTELSDVDSAGVNFLLAAICQELRIGSVLTTAVINWCRTAVKEFDIARRIVKHSIGNHVLPKRVSDDLVMLRDPKLIERGEAALQEIAVKVTDPNFRIFVERGEIHLLNRDGYWRGDDPYEVFDRALATVGSIDAEHAFYLGYELCKARTALTLGKKYIQDEALRWGFLTQNEISAVARRKHGERTP
jgi:dihydropteroate synthase-like protein